AGAGLGCSAAIGVAVLDAIDEALGIERTRLELAAAALSWERVFHGNPSGIDNTMSAVGGVALYRRDEALRPLHSNKPLHLVIGYSGESSSATVGSPRAPKTWWHRSAGNSRTTRSA
ncbi:MAG: hydroxymethylglutaryl-CoA reductase, partial [Deltaproteobacteria bacterium]|nr:hydroxymethylglutaryl-CoA reductase [Deltaproteobacteria bacterium]